MECFSLMRLTLFQFDSHSEANTKGLRGAVMATGDNGSMKQKFKREVIVSAGQRENVIASESTCSISRI